MAHLISSVKIWKASSRQCDRRESPLIGEHLQSSLLWHRNTTSDHNNGSNKRWGGNDSYSVTARRSWYDTVPSSLRWVDVRWTMSSGTAAVYCPIHVLQHKRPTSGDVGGDDEAKRHQLVSYTQWIVLSYTLNGADRYAHAFHLQLSASSTVCRVVPCRPVANVVDSHTSYQSSCRPTTTTLTLAMELWL